MVGPVLIFSAVGITASLRSHTIVNAIESLPYMSDVIEFIGYLLPYLMIIGAFSFVYVLVPNTRVKLKSAFYGAVVAGLLWRWTGTAFAAFAGGSTSYTAIYSGFAILLLFMIWLYLGWLILLIGASIAYYHQHPERLRWKSADFMMSALLRENLGLQLMLNIGRAHYQPQSDAARESSLIDALKIPEALVKRMLHSLRQQGLVVPAGDDGSLYLPARAIDKISLLEILQAARRAEDNELSGLMVADAAVKDIQQRIDNNLQQVLAEQTLQDLVKAETNNN
jgi:membrane protein